MRILVPTLLTLLLAAGCSSSGGAASQVDGLCAETIAFLEARSEFRDLVGSRGDTVSSVEAMVTNADLITERVRMMSEAPFRPNAVVNALKVEQSYDRNYRIDWPLKMDRVFDQEEESGAFLSFAQSCPGAADLRVPPVSTLVFTALSEEDEVLQGPFCSAFTELLEARADFRVHVDRGVTAWSTDVAQDFDRLLHASEALDDWYAEHGLALHPTTHGGAAADFSDIARREVHTRQAAFDPVSLPTQKDAWDDADEAVALGALTCPELESSLLAASTHVPGRTYELQFVIGAPAAAAFCSVQAGADIDSCTVRDPETGETLRVEATRAVLECGSFERVRDAQEGFRQRMIAAVEGDETAILDAKHFLYRAEEFGRGSASLIADLFGAYEPDSLGVPEQTILAATSEPGRWGTNYWASNLSDAAADHQAFQELIDQHCEIDPPVPVDAQMVSAFAELVSLDG